MTPSLRLFGLCGSLRTGSRNRALMAEARRAFGPCDWSEGDLRLPLYDGDLEAQGIPDAVVVVTPEYNKAISGVLKNALDWVSRVKSPVWRDKPVAIMSATAGRSGGERAQSSLRDCLVPFRPHIVPGPEVLVADAANAFDAEGRLNQPRAEAALSDLMTLLRGAIRR
ncbi:MAG: NAD(P)H-dependent oxidoreductase [Alphaproteobacteria bacterium]|nr:NAD(P)H-dependent oxidoreductase [Alphaproteobacteria bacterium]